MENLTTKQRLGCWLVRPLNWYKVYCCTFNIDGDIPVWVDMVNIVRMGLKTKVALGEAAEFKLKTYKVLRYKISC